MKKKKVFKLNELVRIKATSEYGFVDSIFSETEYYVTVDEITAKYEQSELQHAHFKALHLWIQSMDEKTPEEMDRFIYDLFAKNSRIFLVRRVWNALTIFGVLMLMFWFLSMAF